MTKKLTRYEKNPEIIDSEIDDETVMMNIDTGAYFGLNPVATDIWSLLTEPKTLDEIVAKLLESYETEPETCKNETKELLDALLEGDLVIKQQS